jgi:predicted Zn-dependent protease with MMP-like domain
MVTTEIAQLNRECNAWRETLRSYRDEFGQLKNRLQDVAGRQVKRDVLLEIEHLDNQLHIQLINIHDLKHAIKTHSRQIENETASNNGNLPDELLGYHENLFDEYQSLEHTLHELRGEFDHFVNRTQ